MNGNSPLKLTGVTMHATWYHLRLLQASLIEHSSIWPPTFFWHQQYMYVPDWRQGALQNQSRIPRSSGTSVGTCGTFGETCLQDMSCCSSGWGCHPCLLKWWKNANAISIKQKCRHFDEIFITGCTESCQNDNFRCSQWFKFHQNDISVPVYITNGIMIFIPFRRAFYTVVHIIAHMKINIWHTGHDINAVNKMIHNKLHFYMLYQSIRAYNMYIYMCIYIHIYIYIWCSGTGERVYPQRNRYIHANGQQSMKKIQCHFIIYKNSGIRK